MGVASPGASRGGRATLPALRWGLTDQPVQPGHDRRPARRTVGARADLPVYFGNRNWHPLVADTVEQMYRDGHRRVLVFGTSAWGGYSGSVQYHEDIAGALVELSRRIPQAAGDPMLLRKLPQFCTEPAFLDACASWYAGRSTLCPPTPPRVWCSPPTRSPSPPTADSAP